MKKLTILVFILYSVVLNAQMQHKQKNFLVKNNHVIVLDDTSAFENKIFSEVEKRFKKNPIYKDFENKTFTIKELIKAQYFNITLDDINIEIGENCCNLFVIVELLNSAKKYYEGKYFYDNKNNECKIINIDYQKKIDVLNDKGLKTYYTITYLCNNKEIVEYLYDFENKMVKSIYSLK